MVALMGQVFLVLILVTVLIAVADVSRQALRRLKDKREQAKRDAPEVLLQ